MWDLHPMIRNRTLPSWHQLATPEEISTIDVIDRSITDLRSRRSALINRVKTRTKVWVKHHLGRPKEQQNRASGGACDDAGRFRMERRAGSRRKARCER